MYSKSSLTDNNIMKIQNKFIYNFIKCGIIGWSMECFWTGLLALIAKDKTMSCKTSLWMFPIYGLAAFIAPVSKRLDKQNFLVRGGVYTIAIFMAEYLFGSILNLWDACPWDYSKSKFHYKGIIRFDFIPIWFIVGLVYEKILSKS